MGVVNVTKERPNKSKLFEALVSEDKLSEEEKEPAEIQF